MIFESLLSDLSQQAYANENNLNINDLQSAIYPSFESNVTILGKAIGLYRKF